MRHWLRDVIDFSDEPHGTRGPLEHVLSRADDCDNCNSDCKEIADSLALDGFGEGADDYTDGLSKGTLDFMAKIHCGLQ